MFQKAPPSNDNWLVITLKSSFKLFLLSFSVDQSSGRVSVFPLHLEQR